MLLIILFYFPQNLKSEKNINCIRVRLGAIAPSSHWFIYFSENQYNILVVNYLTNYRIYLNLNNTTICLINVKAELAFTTIAMI